MKTSHFKNERGIALILVLGSLVVLSTIAVEFAYNAHVSYELASAERDQLKAYYLARSAYNLIRLELSVEKQLRVQFASLLKDMPGTGMTADPLCKKLPLSTSLLKGLSSGALEGEGGEEGEKEKTDQKKKGEEQAAPEEGEMVKGAEDFLNFDGDFEVSCDTEERKLNLNVFREPASAAGLTGAEATPSPDAPLPLYWEQRNLLKSLLSQKEFQPIFNGKSDEIQKVVNAIADWTDRDDRINEAPGLAGAPEDSEYAGPEFHYKVKNGRYASVAEILLVAGVGDDLYNQLAPQLTVYGVDNKVNLCQASDEMIKAFLFKYSQTVPGVAPLNPEDEDRWSVILTSVRQACDKPIPSASEVASAITAAVGGSDATKLAKQITTDNRFYRIEATGTVHESRVKIVAVIDTKDNPNSWKTLYFRVE